MTDLYRKCEPINILVDDRQIDIPGNVHLIIIHVEDHLGNITAVDHQIGIYSSLIPIQQPHPTKPKIM